jgi:hypothetical protein
LFIQTNTCNSIDNFNNIEISIFVEREKIDIKGKI